MRIPWNSGNCWVLGRSFEPFSSRFLLGCGSGRSWNSAWGGFWGSSGCRIRQIPGFSFGSCRGKVGKRIPRDRGMVRVGKARSSSHSMGDSRSSQPHPSRISLELPLEFWQEKGFGSWELLIPGSFPALFPGIAHSQPLSLDLEIPGLAVPSRGHSRSFGIFPLSHS